MREITVNKENWSGERGKVKIYKNGDIKLNGERFNVIKENDDIVIVKENDNVIAKSFKFDNYWKVLTVQWALVGQMKV